MVNDPDVHIKDIIVARHSLINLEKRNAAKHRTAFPLFNHQFVAISDTLSNKI